MPALLKPYLLDPLERAGSTFTQQLVVLLLPGLAVGTAVHYQAWGAAADTAAFAALLSLLTSVLTFQVPQLAAGPDLALRVAKTGLQSFLGVLAGDHLTHSVVHADWHTALSTAVPVAAAALLKGLAAFAAPWSSGASLLPANLRAAIEPRLLAYGSLLSAQVLDVGNPATLGLATADDTYAGAAVLPPHVEAAVVESAPADDRSHLPAHAAPEDPAAATQPPPA